MRWLSEQQRNAVGKQCFPKAVIATSERREGAIVRRQADRVIRSNFKRRLASIRYHTSPGDHRPNSAIEETRLFIRKTLIECDQTGPASLEAIISTVLQPHSIL